MVSDLEQDLGIVMYSLIKMSTQYVAAVKKVNSMLGIIQKMTENIMIMLL